MTAAVETMAYAKSGGVPWHGLGNPVDDKMTPKQMCEAANIAWKVQKFPLYWKDGDTYRPYPEECALVREGDHYPLTIVGKHWNEVQNLEIAEFLQKFVKSGHMQMETAGALWNGRYIWCLARISKNMDFELGKGSNADQIRSYLLIMNPHVHGKAGIIQYTPIRVVCWNTLNYALGSGLKGKEGAFRMPHTHAFNDETKKRAEEALGLAQKQVEEFKAAATLLSKKKATEEKVEEFFCEVLEYNPSKPEIRPNGKEQREPLLLPKFRTALTYAPGQQLPTALGTWWGAVNAVSYVIDHENGRDRGTALRNAWLGNHADTKRRAVNLALKKAA